MKTETTEQLRARAKRILNGIGHGSKTALAREAGITTATVRRFIEGTVDTDEETLPRIREGLEKLEAKVGKEDMLSYTDGGTIMDEEFNQIIAGLPARLVAASETLIAPVNFGKKIKCLVNLDNEIRDLMLEINERLKRP